MVTDGLHADESASTAYARPVPFAAPPANGAKSITDQLILQPLALIALLVAVLLAAPIISNSPVALGVTLPVLIGVPVLPAPLPEPSAQAVNAMSLNPANAIPTNEPVPVTVIEFETVGLHTYQRQTSAVVPV
jgi:hypothetical protein